MSDIVELVNDRLETIAAFADAGPVRGLRQQAADLLEALLADTPSPDAPERINAAPGAAMADYQDNWDHQTWYHLAELVRINEGRRERAAAQGGDSWANIPQPEPADELASHLRELAKLRQLGAAPPALEICPPGATIFADAMLDAEDAWEHPAELEIERDPAEGVAWQGQCPGGDWFWLKRELPPTPLSIHVEVKPISTIKGGLIIAFATRALEEGIPLETASSPRMSDYYKNFDAYHFSVHRGSSGYCNLRRCGPGLIMLASFADPCLETQVWYELEIVKRGAQIELRVDGKLVVCYLDHGHIQPLLEGGYFGLRHFQGFYGWHRNLRIASL